MGIGIGRRDSDLAMDECFDAWRRARTSEAKSSALTALVISAEPFLGRIVRFYSKGALRDLDREEALQTARLGFVDAVGRVDPTKGPLRPFAMSRIRHELQSLAEVSYGIKIPRRSGLPVAVMRQVERTWSREGREPTREELNGSAALYEASKTRPRIVTSFDAGRVGEDRHGIAETFASEAPSALDTLIELELQCTLNDAASRLGFTIPPRPRNRKESRPMTSMSPLDSIVAQAQSHFEQEEAGIRALEKDLEDKRKRLEDYRKKFAALAGPPTKLVAAPPPVLIALGQDGLSHKIVRYLRENPKARVAAIAIAIGESPRETSTELARLRATGTVTSEGQARGTAYSVARAIPIRKSA